MAGPQARTHYHVIAERAVLERVPQTVTRFLQIQWAPQTVTDTEGVWLHAKLGSLMLGHLKFRVRVDRGPVQVEILPLR
mgnify:FL=1